MSSGRLPSLNPIGMQRITTIIEKQNVKPSSTEVHAIPVKGVVSNHQEAVEHTHALSSAVKIVASENPRIGFRASVRALAKEVAGRMNAVFQRIFERNPSVQAVEVQEDKTQSEIQKDALQLVRLANPDTPRFEWKPNTYIENYKNYIGIQLQLSRPGVTYSTKSLKTLINTESVKTLVNKGNTSLSPAMKEALNSLIRTVSSIEKAEEAKAYFADAKKVSLSDPEKYHTCFEGCKEKVGQILGLDNNKLTVKELKDAYANIQVNLSDSVEIELENHFTTLESMDLMLSPVPEKPNAEFYQKGASILIKEINSRYDGFTDQVKTFLQAKNYQLDDVPENYDNAPKNMDAVKSNLAILDQCLGEEDPLEFRATAKQIAGDFYETIQPFLGKFKEAAINSMGLTGDQWTGKALLDEYNRLAQTEGGTRDNNLESILSNIAFLEESKQKDFAISDEVKVKAEVEAPTAFGLILNVVMRDQMVSKTVIETFDYVPKIAETG